ncbi:MAG: PEP-CTERM sorting domain-containing protein, partial [Candidatus Hydrogenedentes bacterium]|nr:PEP-CTERM sorting domain-containing protein [Candidatus Hydrogenedentota bacterium]
ADTLSSPSMSGALPGSFTSFDISWEGFSQIHIDTFSTNGYYNPASHDATGGDDSVPEPATAVMMGGGLVCAAFIGRRFRRHRSI